MSASSKRRYEVRVRYQGVSTYVVEAGSDEEAAELGRLRYRNGEPEDATGSEHEEVVSVAVSPIPAGNTDFSSKRVGSAHVEEVIGGRARCGVCGWIDEADLKDPTVRAWHGDSLGDDDIPHPKRAAPSADMPDPPEVGEPRGCG